MNADTSYEQMMFEVQGAVADGSSIAVDVLWEERQFMVALPKTMLLGMLRAAKFRRGARNPSMQVLLLKLVDECMRRGDHSKLVAHAAAIIGGHLLTIGHVNRRRVVAGAESEDALHILLDLRGPLGERLVQYSPLRFDRETSH